MTSMLLPLAFLLLSQSPAVPTHRPNFIVIFSDDHGYADLGAQRVRSDIRTPNLDRLAADGVRCSRGYVTAPQCVPSRAGLLTGRYQNRFGVDDNLKGPLPHSERTIADRLTAAGYITGMAGKWHLDIRQQPAARNPALKRKAAAQRAVALPDHLPHRHGFAEYFCGNMNRYHASHDLAGNPLPSPPAVVDDPRFRIDVQTEAALSFIERNAARPFLLYLPYFAPHVPLGATDAYLARFPDADLAPERKLALAMIAAMDDGVGRIRALLEAKGLTSNTLIFFISDNGAPLKTGAWDGSLNEPLVGEKGMLTDGGIRVPFVAAWPGTLPAGKVFDQAVISLDVAPTLLAAAGVEPPASWGLDGVDLTPYFKGEREGPPHEVLFWKWRSQAAALSEGWKYIRLGPDEEFLFDTTSADGEKRNRLADKPRLAHDLRHRLDAWSSELMNPELPPTVNPQDQTFYRDHLPPPQR